jgi:anti-sigma B factor antagonist
MRCERQLATTIVRLAGEFDLTCEEPFQEEFGRVLDGNTETLVLDLRGLDFMDSTGLRILIQISALALSDGFDFEILCSVPVRHVLRETGLDGVLPVIDAKTGVVPASDSPV